MAPRGRPRQQNPVNPDDATNDQPQAGGNENLVQTLVAALRELVQPQAPNVPAALTVNHVVEQFRRYTPPKFNGRSGPLALEEWLMELERIFKHIDCEDAHKISCAVFQLVEDAGHWWNSHLNGMTEAEKRDLTWENFKQIAMEKYFPRSYRNQMQTEFLNLEQGSMTVTEYERRFNKLARFATKLVNEEDEKADRFLRGLRPEIRGILSAHEILNYGLAVKCAQEVESGLETKRTVKNLEHSGKRKRDDSNQTEDNFNSKKGKNDTRSVPPTPNPKPTCPECQRQHFGKCLGRAGICYYCHEPGHYANNCPKMGKKDQKKGGQARLYTFMRKEAGEGSGNT